MAMFDAENAAHPSTVDVRAVGDVDVYVITPEAFRTTMTNRSASTSTVARARHGRPGKCCQAMNTSWANSDSDADVGASTTACRPIIRIRPVSTTALPCTARCLEVRLPNVSSSSGQSAGGNLAAALVLRARDEGLPLPGALVLLTPEVDLTESGDSFQTNLGIDGCWPAAWRPRTSCTRRRRPGRSLRLTALRRSRAAVAPRRSCRPAPVTCSSPTPCGCTASCAPRRRRGVARVRSDAPRRVLRCARGPGDRRRGPALRCCARVVVLRSTLRPRM